MATLFPNTQFIHLQRSNPCSLQILPDPACALHEAQSIPAAESETEGRPAERAVSGQRHAAQAQARDPDIPSIQEVPASLL